MPKSTETRAYADTVAVDREAEKATSRHGDLRLEEGAVLDHFRVVRPLGRGAMGEVYLARDTKLGRKVAIKVIQPDDVDSRQATQAFLREARTTAQLNHPHIVTVYATGEVDGHPYVVLEYIEGGDLRDRLQRAGGSLPVAEALRTAASVARALEGAHAHGVLHRDLKPENVVTALDGRLRVVDFGLARLTQPLDDALGDDAPEPRDASPGTLTGPVGTPEYMSPEHWLDIEMTPASDMWALGVVLFELVTGDVPYALTEFSTLVELARAVCAEEPAPRVGGDGVSVEMAHLVASLLDKDPAERPTATEAVGLIDELLATSSRRETVEGCPFRGLSAFDERHAAYYFGREQEVSTFLERVRTTPVLPVVGPSGAGKSSFVRAGIVPRLREWGYGRVIWLRPGPVPFHALAARLLGSTSRTSSMRSSQAERPHHDDVSTLATAMSDNPMALSLELRRLAEQDGTRVVLFVDQLEELFALVDDENEQRRFLEALLSAADDYADPIRVVFTVRDDFLGRMAVAPAARRALSSVTLLRAPEASTLVSILEQTAAAGGYTFEDEELVAEMVAEVRGEPTSLPLLQFAAEQLWKRRDRNHKRLTRAAYAQMQGVAGALAVHADGVLQALTAQQQQMARTILLRLVSSERTRRVIERARLLEGLPKAGAEEVLSQLVDSRLLSVRSFRGAHREAQRGSPSTVELAHESLVERWDTLRRWLDESREDHEFAAELDQAADLWDRRGRKDSELWAGETLLDARRSLKRGALESSPTARAFIERAWAAHVRRGRVRRAVIVGGMVALAVVVVALEYARRTAEGARTAAEQAREQAVHQRADALFESGRAAFESSRFLEARAEVRAALETSDTLRGRALWWALEREPVMWSRSFDTIIYEISMSADARFVVATAQNRLAYIIDAEVGRVTPLRGHQDQVVSGAVSPRNDLIVTGGWDGELLMWAVDRDERGGVVGASLSHRSKPHKSFVRSITFTPDGAMFATVGGKRDVFLWDAKDGSVVAKLPAKARASCLAFSQDGKQLIVANNSGVVELWDVASRSLTRSVAAHEGVIASLTVSGDGTRLITGGHDELAKVWRLESLALERELTGHRGLVWDIETGLVEGRPVLATASRNSAARVWDLATGELLRIVDGSAGVRSIALSRVAPILVGSSMGRVTAWAVGGKASSRPRRQHDRGLVSVAISGDDAHVVTGSYDSNALVWDARTGEVLRVLRGHDDSVHGVAFTADDRIVTASNDRTLRVWDRNTGTQELVLGGARSGVAELAVFTTPDGVEYAAGGAIDGGVYVWSLADGSLAHVLQGPASIVRSLRVTQREVISASAIGSVQRWSLDTWQSSGSERVGDFGLVSLWVDGDSLRWGLDDLGLVERTQDGVWQRLAKIEGRSYGISHVAENQLVVVGAGGDVMFHDADSGARLAVAPGHTDEVNDLARSASGTWVATVSDDRSLRLWDTTKRRGVWRSTGILREPARTTTHLGQVVMAPDAQHASSALDEATASRAARVVQAKGSDVVCLLAHAGTVELWRTEGAEPRARHHVHETSTPPVLASLPTGCAVATSQGVQLLRDGASPSTLTNEPATAVFGSEAGVMVAFEEEVAVFDLSGVSLRRWPVSAGVSAVAIVGERDAVGYRDGSIELIEGASGKATGRMAASFATHVVAMAPGPRGTLVAGYADGLVALWELSTGMLLGHERLHGPVRELALEGPRLHAVSELGAHLSWDLSLLDMPYCELMGRVWERAPVRWSQGKAVHLPRPTDHTCAR